MTNDNDLQPDRSDIERVQRLVGTHYRLNWIIGRGGMSTVWLATDNDTGDPVAIKVLKPEYTDNTEFRERFRNEANASSLIDSPNVVHTHAYREVLDAGLTFCFIIMEYVRGESLADVLAREKKLPEKRALDVRQQSALGLQAIHAAGMVHRDIKPGNLLITPDGTVKVADFGIAKAAEAVPLTRTGMVVGTAQYVSPEQAQGMKVGPASDIYSLGVVGYEMLTGQRPFRGDSTVSVAIAHINTTPPALPESIGRNTRELIATALRKDPRARYANGAELTMAVAHVRNGDMPPLPETLHQQINQDGMVTPSGPDAPTAMFATNGEPQPTAQFVSPTAPGESIAQVTEQPQTPAPKVQGPAPQPGGTVHPSLGGAATNRGPSDGTRISPAAQQNAAAPGAAAAAANRPGGTPNRGQSPARNTNKGAAPNKNNNSKATRWLWTLIGLLVLIVVAIGAWMAFGVHRDGGRDETGETVTSVITTVVPGENDDNDTAPAETYQPPQRTNTEQQTNPGTETRPVQPTETGDQGTNNTPGTDNDTTGENGNNGTTDGNSGNTNTGGNNSNGGTNNGSGNAGNNGSRGNSNGGNSGSGNTNQQNSAINGGTGTGGTTGQGHSSHNGTSNGNSARSGV